MYKRQIDGESITLPSLTSDPTLTAGKLWYRSDLGRLHLSVGTTKKTVFPAQWSDIIDKPSTYPPSTHTHIKSDITDFVHASTHEPGGSDEINAIKNIYPHKFSEPTLEIQDTNEYIGGTTSYQLLVSLTVNGEKTRYVKMDAKSGSKGNIRVCFYNPLTDEETLIQTISVPNYEDYETKQSIIFKCKDGEIRLYGYDSLSSTSKVYIKNIEIYECELVEIPIISGKLTAYLILCESGTCLYAEDTGEDAIPFSNSVSAGNYSLIALTSNSLLLSSTNLAVILVIFAKER